MMPVLPIRPISGEVPRLAAHLLPEGAAQVSVNCDFTGGTLKPLKGLGTEFTAHTSAQPVRSVFTDNGLRFFAWNLPTRAILSPTIDDTVGRVYYQTHGQGIRVAQTSGMLLANQQPRPPSSSWKPGVKAPPIPTATLVGTGGSSPETITYVAVAINIWGEESAPSPPRTVTVTDAQSVNLTVAHTADSDEVPLQGIIYYRTYDASDSSGYILISATPTALGGTFNDATKTPQTAVVLASQAWAQVPANAANLCYAGNGSLCCSVGKDLVFTEPYYGHAWAYRMTFPHAVIGVLAIDGGLLVTTEREPYLVSGAHPSQMSQLRLAIEQGGWSDTALATVEGAAMYASNDGIVSVFGGQPSIEGSRSLFRRSDWRSAYGAARQNLRLIHHDGHILGLVDPAYPSASAAQSFILQFDGEPKYFTKLTLPSAVYGASISGTTDQLFVGTATGFAEFAELSATPLSMTWHSREYRYPAPVSFACGEIDCTGSVTLEILRDGVVLHTVVATDRTQFRLPPHNPAYRWSFRLSGTGEVRQVAVGPSFKSLGGV